MEFGQEFTYEEYVADGIVHMLGVVAALGGAILLLYWGLNDPSGNQTTPILAYAGGLIASFTLSAAYNMTLHRGARRLLRRLDHAAIFVMIAGTYTPIALIGIGGESGIKLAAAAWIIAIIGIALKLFFFNTFERTSFALTLMQGWLAVFMITPLISAFNPVVLILLIIGGLVFTLGIIFHLGEHLRFNRAIWHGHVLLGATAHYAAIVMMLDG